MARLPSSLPPELIDVLKLSLMNLGTIAAGYIIGRLADQPQKIIVGGFAAGAAGVLFSWLLMLFGLTEMKPRLFVGIFVVSALLGLVWAWLGYLAGKARRQARGPDAP